MRCRKAKELISLYVAPDGPWLSPEDSHALEAHMAVCEPCREDCRESREVISTLQKYWQISEDTAALLEKGRQGSPHRISSRIIWPFGASRRVAAWAAAACLVIGVLGLWAFLNRRTCLPGPSRTVVFTSQDLPLVIESADGARIASEAIVQTLSGETKHLVLNNKHHVVMNAGTRLSIEPFVKAEGIGCLVSLALGEVYVHVEHDGNPFVVATAYGRAVITGTAFNVKATENSTTLVVTEGTVRFESESGVVKVAAGQRSEIVGQSGPSIPLSCNADKLTAWATGYKPMPILAQAKPAQEAYDITDLPLSVTPEPIVLESVDYEQWVEQKREWFKQQFPWIFQLKEALAKEGIEVDYPELLIKTGDIWQIVYPGRVYGIIPVIDPNSLLAMANEYDLDTATISRIVSSVSQIQTLRDNITFGTVALDNWLVDCSRIHSSRTNDKELVVLCEYSQSISKYIENTRALLWLCVQAKQLQISLPHKQEILRLLKCQVSSAYVCHESAWGVSLTATNECSRHDEFLKKYDAIREIKQCERLINDYQTTKTSNKQIRTN